MRLSLAAARKYALIICMRLLPVLRIRLLPILYNVHLLLTEPPETPASLSDDAPLSVLKMFFGGLHFVMGV